MSGMPDSNPLSSGDVAKLFGVSIGTVANWANSGKLPFFRTPGGQRRFNREDVARLIEGAEPVGDPS